MTEESVLFLILRSEIKKREIKMIRLLLSICFIVVLVEPALSQTLSVEGKHIGSSFVGNNGNKNTAYNGVQLLMRHSCFMRW